MRKLHEADSFGFIYKGSLESTIANIRPIDTIRFHRNIRQAP